MKMVGTRWESSNRPLFVRTVWKDGHHHVVLRKDEEDLKAKTARSARRNLSSSRCSKKTPPLSAESGANFKVPSVKLLLAGLRTFRPDSKIKRYKTETREFVKSAITVDIIPSDTVRYSDLNKQVSFKNEKPHPKLTTKSNSVDVSHCYVENDSIATPPPFSYDKYWMEQFNTSLSERVMIWLDLAIQNHKQFKNVDLKKRVMTAKACPIFHRDTIVKNIEKQEIRREENKEKEKIGPPPFVTSQMEFEQIEQMRQTREEKKPMRVNTVKRQLHIFLPNLPKKTSDSGSFLSSKCSSFQGK